MQSVSNAGAQEASQAFIQANNLSKSYDSNLVLSDINFRIDQGEIVGLIGPNGAGKSTLLKSIMGLINYSGELSIFGQNPFKNRTKLLQSMSYIADVASLPGWMKVSDILEFVAQTHPKFDIQRANQLLKDTPIQHKQKIQTLSKGMKTRLHLVIILSINTSLLVLDEPTLGLDVMVRRDFQDRLVQDYYNQQRSILITTHQVDEIESILTRVLFIKDGRISMDIQKSELQERYIKLVSAQNIAFSDPNLQPLYQRALPNHTELIFENANVDQLAQYGQIETPSLEDLFVAVNSTQSVSTVA